jgi:sialidase-1
MTRRQLILSALLQAESQADVWTAGTEGYHSFRIPSLLVTRRGTLLAFCEGRRHSRSDTGDIDLVLKRSTDGGRTWDPAQVVVDDGPNTMGNPCPVQDRKSGRIWLPITRNLGEDQQEQITDRTAKGTREVWILYSDDDGRTWSKPVEITGSVKRPDWTWYATGPGCGIQLRSGRLLIPCDHYVAGTKMRRSHVIYSDDHGKTWKVGGVVGDHTNECQAAELRDGTVLINMRSYHGKNRRAVATSRDGGLTWSEIRLDEALIEPVCQAALIATRRRELVFSNPASQRRERLTLKVSRDDGTSWRTLRVLHPGPAAYSALAELRDGSLACLYERGEKSAYEKITLARLPPGPYWRGASEEPRG